LVVGFLFPLTIAFAELPSYLGYVMPRLAAQLKNGWIAWLIAAIFLAAQHCFLPLILDGRFMLWRLGMYLSFALFIGLLIKLRPSLLPYAVIIHALIDISTLSVYWMV
jgi:membrane protease YdiL (CAAX protease family)